MTDAFFRPRDLFAALLLPLLAVSPVAGAQTRRGAPPHAAAARPAVADNAIIPLPLNPMVPPGKRACTMRTATGLGYTMLRTGTGAKPAATDTVLVNYLGYLASTGAVFDQGMSSALQVDGVIPGFSQGLQMMTRGSVARLCIPAAIGYGAQGAGPIPANADLVFQVELVDFKAAAEVEALRKGAAADPAASTDPAATTPTH